jgi:iron complex outermembrane receptor protein
MDEVRHYFHALGGLTCAAGLACGAPAMAQTPGPVQIAQNAPGAPTRQVTADTGRLETVVVTAQRRSESLQKTALTVQVLGRKALAESGVTSPAQLTAVLPTVQVATSGPATAVYVRGVGGFASTAATSPAVPYYIDGVYAARTQSVDSELYDVDRLELVKGPQGTLYGRNASGGAVNILTRKPDFDGISGHVDAEFGNYGDKSSEFAINVPISEYVAIRASGTVVGKDGFTSTGLGDDQHESVRLKLLWKPNSDVSVLVNGSYGHIGGLGSAVVPLNQDIPHWYPWIGISDPNVTNYVAKNAVVPVPGFVRNTDPGDANEDLNFFNISTQLDWNLGRVDGFNQHQSARKTDDG